MPEQDVQTQGQGKETDTDSETAYQNTIKEILGATDYESNSRIETEGAVEANSDNKSLDDTKDLKGEKEEGKPLEKGQVEQEGEKKEIEILGKTPHEIEELINQRTQEAVRKHEDTLKDYYESEKSELVINSKKGQIEQVLKEYDQAIVQVDEAFQRGEITAQQYKNAINQANSDINELRQKHTELERTGKQTNIPKIKRTNNEYYQKIQAEMPEFKDPIVKKYAENLKEKVYDAGGIDIAKGGFVSYVRDFITPAVTEAEIRGYQKIKNEIEKNNAKAKAKAAVQSGDDVQAKTSIRTAEDIQNASKEDWLKFVLN